MRLCTTHEVSAWLGNSRFSRVLMLGSSSSVGAFTRIGEEGCSGGFSGAISDNLQIDRRERFSR